VRGPIAIADLSMSDKAFLQHCQQWGRGLRSAHIVAQTTDKRKCILTCSAQMASKTHELKQR